MKNNIVNIGIVGVGKLGTYHIQKLLNKSNCNFIGIHDIDKNKMNNFKEKYNINIFDSLESLIDKSDAIIVSAPTIYHYDLAKKSLLKDCHVFIEKPVADNISDAVNLKKYQRKRIK